MTQSMHNFSHDLEWSLAQNDEPFWSAVYHRAFPNMVGHTAVRHDSIAQRNGIDRFVSLSSGQVLRIDEKKRRAVYDDIALEYISNDQVKTPGWIEKDLSIDYLAYAFMPNKRVYLFPWLMLRRAWLNYKAEWIAEFQTIIAKNPGYQTLSLCVPIQVLRDAVYQAALIDVSDQFSIQE